MTCSRCGADLDPDRAEFLRERQRPLTCMACSTEQPAVVFLDYSHKTAGSVVIVGSDPEQIRLARRAYARAR